MIKLTYKIHDKATPALQEIQRRLADRRFFLRGPALSGNKPYNVPPPPKRYILVGGKIVQAGGRRLPPPTAKHRFLLGGGVKYPYPAAASQPRLHPTVLRQARHAAIEFVRAEIGAALNLA